MYRYEQHFLGLASGRLKSGTLISCHSLFIVHVLFAALPLIEPTLQMTLAVRLHGQTAPDRPVPVAWLGGGVMNMTINLYERIRVSSSPLNLQRILRPQRPVGLGLGGSSWVL